MKIFKVVFSIKGDEFEEKIVANSAEDAEAQIHDDYFEARIVSIVDVKCQEIDDSESELYACAD